MSDVSDLIAIAHTKPCGPANQSQSQTRPCTRISSGTWRENSKIRGKTCFSIFWNAFVSFHIRFRSLSPLKPEFHAVAADRSVSSHHVRGPRFDPRLILPITSQVNKLPGLAQLWLAAQEAKLAVDLHCCLVFCFIFNLACGKYLYFHSFVCCQDSICFPLIQFLRSCFNTCSANVNVSRDLLGVWRHISDVFSQNYAAHFHISRGTLSCGEDLLSRCLSYRAALCSFL